MAFILSDKKQSWRSADFDGLQPILPCPHIFFLSAPGYGYAVSSVISHPALLPDRILSDRLHLRSSHCHSQTYIIYCFFCNSCFSQYNTPCVWGKFADKILSVSRETQYFSVFFCAPSVSFLVKFGLKPVFAFWLFARRVFVFCSTMRFCADAYCAGEVFFLRVCLLVWFVVLFLLGLIGWISLARPTGVFFCLRGYFSCSRVYPAACPNPSARQTELMRVALVGRCFFLCLRLFAIVFACFVVHGVLRTAVTSACQSGGFFLGLGLALR